MGPHKRCVIAMNTIMSMVAMVQVTYSMPHHGVNTIYTRYCVNKPSGYALGFINTIPRVYGIHTW